MNQTNTGGLNKIGTGLLQLTASYAEGAITGATWAAGAPAKFTFASALSAELSVGSVVVVSGVTPAGYNGTYTITSLTSSAITVAIPSGSPYSSTSPGTFMSGGVVTNPTFTGGTTISAGQLQIRTTFDGYTLDFGGSLTMDNGSTLYIYTLHRAGSLSGHPAPPPEPSRITLNAGPRKPWNGQPSSWTTVSSVAWTDRSPSTARAISSSTCTISGPGNLVLTGDDTATPAAVGRIYGVPVRIGEGKSRLDR